MARLSRVETQAQNRGKVLAAAKAEFTERGFRETKIDRIAERAELTRGAVYSNFPSKRALYFAVLAQVAEQDAEPEHPPTARTAGDVLADFARAWVDRIPLASDEQHSPARLDRDLLPEIASDQRTSLPFAQLTNLGAIVLGLCLEHTRHRSRMVQVAELALTTLHGASQLASAAPGFGDPFHLVLACEQLAGLDLDDVWQPAYLQHISPARPVDQPWTPPELTDALRDEPVKPGDDEVVAVLGLHRLSAVEEALRVAPSVTLALVTGNPGELGPLARLAVADLRRCLRAAVPPKHWPRLRIVHDESGAVAAAAGVSAVSDATETAVRIRENRIVARAEGWGACHAAAST